MTMRMGSIMRRVRRALYERRWETVAVNNSGNSSTQHPGKLGTRNEIARKRESALEELYEFERKLSNSMQLVYEMAESEQAGIVYERKPSNIAI